jgi:hypothetical protein
MQRSLSRRSGLAIGNAAASWYGGTRWLRGDQNSSVMCAFILAAVIWQLAVVLFLGSAIVPAGFAQADTEPPVLTNFDFNPKSIDVSNGDGVVTCEMTITDSLSGVGSALCRISAPAGPARLCTAYAPSSGTTFDGVWACNVTIPQYAAEGIWEVQFLNLIDNAGNHGEIFGTRLLRAKIERRGDDRRGRQEEDSGERVRLHRKEHNF